MLETFSENSFPFERSNVKLGSGGNGEVILGRSLETHSLVALKKAYARAYQTEADRRISPGEDVLLTCHKHPNIVPILGFCRTPSATFMALELQDSDLSVEIMAGKTHLCEDVAKLALYPVLSALNFLHQARVVHRDIKPGNILLRRDPCRLLGAHVYLGDFGQAHYVPEENESGNDGSSCDVGNISCGGTFYYQAPELLNGKVKPSGSFKCDMWAFGCTLYEMLAGVAAFSGASQMQVINMIHKRMGTDFQSFPSVVAPQSLLDGIGEGISHECRSLLLGLLALAPEARLSAEEALRHPFFAGIAQVSDQVFRQDELFGGPLLDMKGFPLVDLSVTKFKPIFSYDHPESGPTTGTALMQRNLNASDESSIHLSYSKQSQTVAGKLVTTAQCHATFSNMRTTALFADGSSFQTSVMLASPATSPPRALHFDRSPSTPPPQPKNPQDGSAGTALFRPDGDFAE